MTDYCVTAQDKEISAMRREVSVLDEWIARAAAHQKRSSLWQVSLTESPHHE